MGRISQQSNLLRPTFPYAPQVAVLAIGLLDYCADTREQRKIQKEVAAGDWNLNALRVDATAASNSATRFERED